MSQSMIPGRFGWTAIMLATAVVLSGCGPPDEPQTGSLPQPEAGQKPPAEREDSVVSEAPVESETPLESKGPLESKDPVESEAPVEPGRTPFSLDPDLADEPMPDPLAELGPDKPLDLGPPLVEQLDSLKALDPKRPVWLDMANKRVVMVGQVCQTDAPLELFACLRNTKEHEAIVSVDIEAVSVHAGLLAVGAEVGSPARFDPIYVPAQGTEVEVTVVWKDGQGRRKTARAQDWILDTQTEKPMTYQWVFAGSAFWEDEEAGQRYYQAEGGDFICVSNFSSAMLDLPIESSQANSGLLFQAYTERIPPLGTPVTILLMPKLEEK